jgi:uncharacterized protein (TIGR03437 family)
LVLEMLNCGTDMFRELFMMGMLGASSLTGTYAFGSAASANSAPAIRLGEVVLDSQGRASVDVILTQGDRPVTALQFDIQYQDQTISMSESLGSAAISAGKTLWTSNPQAATRRMLIAGLNANPLGDGIVATLSVQVKGGASPDLHPLAISNVVASDSSGYAVFLPVSPVVLAEANAASYAAGAVAPGDIVVIWGRSFSPAATYTLQLTSDGSVTSSLAGTRVLFDGVPAPLLYTTEDQLGAIVPYEVDGHSQTSLQVEYQGIQSGPLVLAVTKSSPGVFTLDGSGQGQGAILNQDGTINGPGNPAPRGSVVSVYATGEGQTSPPGADGGIVEVSGIRPLLPVTGSIGDQSAEVSYAGSAVGQVSGLLQVNMQVPASAPSGGAVPLRITIGGSSQSGVTIAVQ